MSNAQHAAVAFILSTYAAVDQASIVSSLNAPKAPKVKAEPRVKLARNGHKVKASDGSPVPSAVTGTAGMIDAPQFIAAMHDAGKVPKVLDNGTTLRVPSGDPIKRRDDERSAIAAFIGYDPRLPHGVQVANATRRAQYQIKPSMGSDRKVCDPTLSGFVAGMPNDVRRMVDDLQGREALAAEAMAGFDHSARNVTDPAIRTLHEGLSMLESERIASIRADLAKLIG